MTKINSRAKGKRGELEVRDLLRSLGFPDAERSARNGVKAGEDIHCPSLHALGWSVEVKNTGTMKLGSKEWDRACQQAIDDAEGRGTRWVLFWKCGRGMWAMTWNDPANGDRLTVTRPAGMERILKGADRGEA